MLEEAKGEGYNATATEGGSVRIFGAGPVKKIPGYEEGRWWVQDPSSSLAAKVLRCEEGGRVLEICSAPGGKTCQLWARGFEVTAVEKSER